MRTRRVYYRDYGVTVQEKKELLKYCRYLPNREKNLLQQVAEIINLDISGALIISLVLGKSYEKVNEKGTVYLGREDFYGYQRLVLVNFRRLLIRLGIYPFINERW